MGKRKLYTSHEYLIAFQDGKEEGFNFFFREYYAALCYFCYQITKDKELAEETASDALMKLWERHANFETVPGIKSFLYTTARNASIDWLRRQKTKLARSKELIGLDLETGSDVPEKIIEAETYREVISSLQVLPPKCRRIFIMLYFEGKDYNQIAEELRLSINTIRVQKARAIALLRKQISLILALLACIRCVLNI